jgi:hypothetical protein
MMDQLVKLRIVYSIALANVAALVVWGLLFDVPGVLGVTGPVPAKVATIVLAIDGFLVVSFLLAAAPLVFLLVRPMGWGKLLLPVYGVAWVFHAGVFVLTANNTGWSPHIAHLWVPAACGGLMFVLALAHQFIDPKFLGPSSRP